MFYFPSHILYTLARVPTLLVTKSSRTFQAPTSIFPGPCRKSAMFKYSDKPQLRSLGERCKLWKRV